MDDDEQISLYQIWDNTNWYRGTLTNSNPKYTQIALFLTNTKPKNQIQTKEPKIYKYQIRIVHKPKRVTKQIQMLQCTKKEQITKPQNQNQAATNLSHYSKLQPTNFK